MGVLLDRDAETKQRLGGRDVVVAVVFPCAINTARVPILVLGETHVSLKV